MLLIIEILFLVAGLWAIIAGRMPAGLFRVLFGKGQYELPPPQARLFGLLLSSPFPLSFLVAFLLGGWLGQAGLAYSTIFEALYVVAITVTSIVVARKIRRPEIPQTNPAEAAVSSPTAAPPPRRIQSYGARLLIMLGLVVLGFITLVSGLTLITTVVSLIVFGGRWTGDFWSDIFPFILVLGITGIGLFGGIKLYKLLTA